MVYAITNVNKPHDLARKLRRDWAQVAVRGTTVACGDDENKSRPWAVLAGHMTNSTQVIPMPRQTVDEAAREN